MLFSSLTTRKIHAYFRNFISLFKLFLIFASVFCIYLDSHMALYAKLRAEMIIVGFRLTKVVFEGVSNLPRQDVHYFVNYSDQTFIFDIDLSSIAKKVQENPWVANCIIFRKLPDSIYIKILERKPIAIWQNGYRHYLIDRDGHCIDTQVFDYEKFAYLIHVVGKGANLYAHQLITQISTDPDLSAKVRTAVRYGERRWNIFLDNITIQMPEQNFLEAWQYLSEMNKNNKLLGCKIKSIDLRNESKFYVEYY